MIKKFSEFINSTVQIDESKDKEKSNESTPDSTSKSGCNIVFVTKNPTRENSQGEYSRFKSSCDKYGVNIYPVDVDKVKFRLTDDNKLEIDGVGTFSKSDTLFMFRHAIKIKSTDEEKQVTQKNVKMLKSLLKANGFYMCNDSSVAGVCKNKLKTFDILNKKGVSTIDTTEIDRHLHDKKNLNSVDNMSKFLSSHNLTLPVVVKVCDSSQGLGIFKCEDMNILVSIVQYLVRTKGNCIIQPYCEIDYDVRVHVFCQTLNPQNSEVDDYKVIASMKREKPAGGKDFRTNFSIGGKISKYTITKEEEQLAKEAAHAIGAVWCGVDVCKDHITGNVYVIEVNSSPALKGVSQVSKIPPADMIVKSVKKTLGKETFDEKEIGDRELVGYYETIQLDDIQIVGNFDTGNSVMPALKSNVFAIDGDKVTFEIMGQKVTKKIERMKSILHGGIKSEERPVVKMDITFNGKTLKDVEMCVRGLTDVEKEREKKTGKKVGGKRILLSTDIIDKLGLIVHPDRNKKYVKTEKPKKKK